MSTVVKDLGAVSAYAYAVEKGYTGTEAEFAELMADYAEVGQRAEDAADRAEAALDEFTSVTADATTLPEGSSATAEYSDGHLTLGIPKGDKGDTGAKGDGAVYAVIGNMASVIPAGTDGYLERAYTITIPVTFYSGKDNVTGSVTSSDLYISRTSGGSGEMDTVPGSTYRNVKTATIIYAIPAGWKVGNGRITLTVTIGTVTLTYYHAYTTAPTGPQGEQGIQGPIGATPNLTIGTVTTLQPTAPATATISGTADNPVLSFGIPKGDTGEVSQDQFDAALALKADVTELLKAFPTDTASGAVASFADGANVPVKSLIVNIDPVQSGSGDPSPDNVRPISGLSEVNVNACGVNVWDEEWIVASNSRVNSKNPISVVSGESYYFKTPVTMYINAVDKNGAYVSYLGGVTNGTMVIPDGVKYIGFSILDSYGTTYNHDISINYPSTDHDYHPYSGQSINIALGQTVYGGKLDVTNGVLTIDRAGIDFGDSPNWINYKTGGFRTILPNSISGTMIIDDPNLITTMYKTYPSSATLTNGTASIANGSLYVVNSNFTTDVEEFKTAMTGQKAVYKLDTPITVQLTPHKVTALLGSNNVWADSGDSTVEYRADPTLYIQRLTEPDADMVADSNITSGSYFMVGNTLYKATANIASGATIAPNVNCTRKSLSEALNELNA